MDRVLILILGVVMGYSLAMLRCGKCFYWRYYKKMLEVIDRRLR